MNTHQRWQELSAKWKDVKREFSEPCVHDMRVASRRFIAELELAISITRSKEANSLKHRLTRVLKLLGPLRDIQVHVNNLSTLGQSDLLSRFAIFLRERERDEIRRLRSPLREKRRRSLRRAVRNIDKRVRKEMTEMARPALRSAIQKTVKERRDAVLSAHADYCRSRSPRNFHRMRVKFKRYRYTVEAARSELRNVSSRELDAMRELQSIMGEIHDLDTLREELAAWSGNSGKVLAAQLRRKYRTLLKSFNGSPFLSLREMR